MTSKDIYWFYSYLALLFAFVIGLFTTIRFEGKDMAIGLLFAGLIFFMTLSIGFDIAYQKLKSEKKEKYLDWKKLSPLEYFKKHPLKIGGKLSSDEIIRRAINKLSDEDLPNSIKELKEMIEKEESN